MEKRTGLCSSYLRARSNHVLFAVLGGVTRQLAFLEQTLEILDQAGRSARAQIAELARKLFGEAAHRRNRTARRHVPTTKSFML